MREHESHEQNLAAQLNEALGFAQSRLDAAGRIVYDKLNSEDVSKMTTELGPVRHIVPQQPIHKKPPIEVVDEDGQRVVLKGPVVQFMELQDNFYFRFNANDFLGKLYRQSPAVRRFAILFPELDAALQQATPPFAKKLLEGHDMRRVIYEEDDSYARALHLAYGIMCQLVDADDAIDGGEGTKIKNLSDLARSRVLFG